jgi:hypothetical protein
MSDLQNSFSCSANQRAAALAIAVAGMWGKTTVKVTRSANSAYTSDETVNFVSKCVDREIKLKQNKIFFQFYFTCRTGLAHLWAHETHAYEFVSSQLP